MNNIKSPCHFCNTLCTQLHYYAPCVFCAKLYNLHSVTTAYDTSYSTKIAAIIYPKNGAAIFYFLLTNDEVVFICNGRSVTVSNNIVPANALKMLKIYLLIQ